VVHTENRATWSGVFTPSLWPLLLIGLALAVLLLGRVGRRVLLLSGTVGLVGALIVLGLFFETPGLAAHAPWLALVALVLSIASFAIGLGPVFCLMISETGTRGRLTLRRVRRAPPCVGAGPGRAATG
jgi:hypothetical protein